MIPHPLKPDAWWEGRPFTANDVLRLARDAAVPVLPDADANQACAALNDGVNMFASVRRRTSTQGEFRKWFEKIEKVSSDLLDVFGEPGTEDRTQAIRNFLDRPNSCRAGGLDPNLVKDLLAQINALRVSASVAAARAKLKETGHRSAGTDLLYIADGVRLCWRILTGADERGFSKSGETAARRVNRGPFISFVGTALAEAAAGLAGANPPVDQSIIEAIRNAGSSPDRVEHLYNVWKAAGGPDRWGLTTVGEKL